MSFWTIELLGVSFWIWCYFLLSILLGLGVIAYINREKLRKKYYDFRFPEKVIKVMIHYKSNQYKRYWRVIPDVDFFKIDGKTYNYSDSNVLKENDFFMLEGKDYPIIKVKDGKEKKEYKYLFKRLYGLKERKRKYMQIHYWFNDPNPIGFDFDQRKIDLNSTQLQTFKDNDLFAKLLTLESEKKLMMLLFILVVGNLIATVFILARMMEWL